MEFTIADDPMVTTPQERDIVPPGVHTMTIRHAEEGPNEYKVTDENPQGLCLKLRLSATSGDYRFVFDDIPKHLGWRAKQLADALGVSASGTKVSLDPESLVNRSLTVEVSHYTSKAGKVSAVVKRYMAGQTAAKPKASQPRQPAAKPANLDPDHIPF